LKPGIIGSVTFKISVTTKILTRHVLWEGPLFLGQPNFSWRTFARILSNFGISSFNTINTKKKWLGYMDEIFKFLLEKILDSTIFE